MLEALRHTLCDGGMEAAAAQYLSSLLRVRLAEMAGADVVALPATRRLSSSDAMLLRLAARGAARLLVLPLYTYTPWASYSPYTLSIISQLSGHLL